MSADYDSASAAEDAVRGECQCHLIQKGGPIHCPRCAVIESVTTALNKAERSGIARGKSRAATLAAEVENFLRTRSNGDGDAAEQRLRAALDAFDVVEELATPKSAPRYDDRFAVSGDTYHALIELTVRQPDGTMLATQHTEVGIRSSRDTQHVDVMIVDHIGAPVDLTRSGRAPRIDARLGILLVDGNRVWFPVTVKPSGVLNRMRVEFLFNPDDPRRAHPYPSRQPKIDFAQLTRSESNDPGKLLYAMVRSVVSLGNALAWLRSADRRDGGRP